MPLVSLIIPAYNAEKYLRRCLNSAMEQTFRDMEIIVINDGSTDTTLQSAGSTSRWTSGSTLLTRPTPGSRTAGIRAIQMAAGKYLQFMDSDDWLTGTPRKVWFTPLRNRL